MILIGWVIAEPSYLSREKRRLSEDMLLRGVQEKALWVECFLHNYEALTQDSQCLHEKLGFRAPVTPVLGLGDRRIPGSFLTNQYSSKFNERNYKVESLHRKTLNFNLWTTAHECMDVHMCRHSCTYTHTEHVPTHSRTQYSPWKFCPYIKAQGKCSMSFYTYRLGDKAGTRYCSAQQKA